MRKLKRSLVAIGCFLLLSVLGFLVWVPVFQSGAMHFPRNSFREPLYDSYSWIYDLEESNQLRIQAQRYTAYVRDKMGSCENGEPVNRRAGAAPLRLTPIEFNPFSCGFDGVVVSLSGYLVAQGNNLLGVYSDEEASSLPDHVWFGVYVEDSSPGEMLTDYTGSWWDLCLNRSAELVGAVGRLEIEPRMRGVVRIESIRVRTDGGPTEFDPVCEYRDPR